MIPAPEIHIEQGTPDGLRDMIWEEFFTSRGRGQTLDLHAPYLAERDSVRSIIAKDEVGISGGLIVKTRRIAGEAPVSMIGFVCVRPEKRGQQISVHLLQKAVEDARARGIAGLILWTTTPRVYAHAGFQPDPRDAFFQTGQLKVESPVKYSVKPLDLDSRGLPAFADRSFILTSDQASATVLETPNGDVLAEWTGSDNSVIDLIGTYVKQPFWVNAQASDSLPEAISRRNGPPLLSFPSRRLALSVDQFSIMNFPEIRILDRI